MAQWPWGGALQDAVELLNEFVGDSLAGRVIVRHAGMDDHYFLERLHVRDGERRVPAGPDILLGDDFGVDGLDALARQNLQVGGLFGEFNLQLGILGGFPYVIFVAVPRVEENRLPVDG